MKLLPRFSLLTLLLAAITAGCALLLWRNWAPWQVECVMRMKFVCFSADGHWMAISDASRESLPRHAQFWDVKAWKVLSSIELETPESAESLPLIRAISNAGTRAVLSRIPSRTMTVLDTRTGSRIDKMEYQYTFTPDFRSLPKFSNDGASIFYDSRIWRIGSNERALEIGMLGAPAIDAVDNSSPAFQRARTGAIRAKTLTEFWEHVKRIWRVRSVMSSSGKLLFTNLDDTNVSQIWDFATQQKIGELPGQISEHFTLSSNDDRIAFTDVPNPFVYSARSPQMLIAGIPSGRIVVAIPWKTETGMIYSEVSPNLSVDGKHLAYLRDGKYLSLWNEGVGLNHTNIQLENSEMSFSPDGRILAVQLPADGSDADRARVTLLDSSNGGVIATLKHNEYHFEPHFLADGLHLKTETETETGNSTVFWRKHRPEAWWGLACLPEFWALCVCLTALLHSFRRDKKILASTHNN